MGGLERGTTGKSSFELPWREEDAEVNSGRWEGRGRSVPGGAGRGGAENGARVGKAGAGRGLPGGAARLASPGVPQPEAGSRKRGEGVEEYQVTTEETQL